MSEEQKEPTKLTDEEILKLGEEMKALFGAVESDDEQDKQGDIAIRRLSYTILVTRRIYMMARHAMAERLLQLEKEKKWTREFTENLEAYILMYRNQAASSPFDPVQVLQQIGTVILPFVRSEAQAFAQKVRNEEVVNNQLQQEAAASTPIELPTPLGSWSRLTRGDSYVLVGKDKPAQLATVIQALEAGEKPPVVVYLAPDTIGQPIECKHGITADKWQPASKTRKGIESLLSPSLATLKPDVLIVGALGLDLPPADKDPSWSPKPREILINEAHRRFALWCRTNHAVLISCVDELPASCVAHLQEHANLLI